MISHFTLAVLLPLPLWGKYAPNPLQWAGSIFFPSEPAGTPPLDLSVARYFAAAGQWKKAADEFARVVEWHPSATEAWVGWIESANHLADASDQTREVLADGLRVLQSPAARDTLYAAFAKTNGIHPAQDVRLSEGCHGSIVVRNRLIAGAFHPVSGLGRGPSSIAVGNPSDPQQLLTKSAHFSVLLSLEMSNF